MENIKFKRVTIWYKISHGDVAEDSSLQGCDTVSLVISRRFDGPYFSHVEGQALQDG
jgi:hypothetical protein